MPRRRPIKVRPECYTDTEVQLMMRCCSYTGSGGLRNRALIAFMWRCGARVQESVDLMPEDIDWDTQTIVIARGKGDRQRVLGVDTQTLALIRQWMDRREQLGIGYDCPVFCGVRRPGSQLETGILRETFREIRKRAGIEKRVHAHGLRHTFAFNLLREGHPVDFISKALGHSTMKTTIEYLDHLHPIAIVEGMKAREWRLEASAKRQRRKEA